MYNYQYTIKFNSIKDNLEEIIQQVILPFKISFSIDYSKIIFNELIINIKGKKEELDKAEFKIIKKISSLFGMDGFIKTSNKLDDIEISLDDLNPFLIYKNKLAQNPLEEAVRLLKIQKVGLIKSTNGYYLVGLSNKNNTVNKIRQILNLPSKPLTLLVKNTLQASKFLSISKKEEALLKGDIKPFVKIRKKNIHRLQKSKSFPLNKTSPQNQYFIKLPKNEIEEYLASEVNIPLVFKHIKTSKDIFLDQNIDFILSFHKDFFEIEDSYMQLLYGKNQFLKRGVNSSYFKIMLEHTNKNNCDFFANKKNNLTIFKNNELILSKYNEKKEDFLLKFDLLDKDKKELQQTTNHTIALAHGFISNFKKALIFEFCTNEANVFIYENSNLLLKKIYSFSKKPKDLFDLCAKTRTNIKEFSFEKESQLICDNFYEICFEQNFEYEVNIKDSLIDIKMDSKIPKNEMPSTLLNTFTKIIKDIQKEYDLPCVLCGDIFENKNLTENIIDLFDENSIQYFISLELPINSSSSSLGAMLDFCIKN